MTLSIKATAASGETIEAPISHIDLLKATYGIEDQVPLDKVIHAIITAMLVTAMLVLMIISEGALMKGITLFTFLQMVGFTISQTVTAKYKLEVLEKTATGNPWIPALTNFLVNIATAAIAAILAMKISGFAGFIAGLAIMTVNPLTRMVPDALFALRVQSAKRIKAKNEKMKEGLGG